jgi:transposase
VLSGPATMPRGATQRGVEGEVLNAIFYVLSTGCQWQALPKVKLRSSGGVQRST